MEVLTIIC